MFSLDDPVVLCLGDIELREVALLQRGVVDSGLTRTELDDILGQRVEQSVVPELVAKLIEHGLVVQHGSLFRSRMAETVRLMVKLRQSFRDQRVTDGTPLVADFRLLHKARRRPRLDTALNQCLQGIEGLTDVQRQTADLVAPGSVLRAFQARSIDLVLGALRRNHDRAIVIAAGTGSGKTAAFYVPALMFIADLINADDDPWVKALALYPRNELLKDQFGEVLRWATAMHKAKVISRPLRIGAWFSGTPNEPRFLDSEWRAFDHRGSAHVFPLAQCPVTGCGGELLWRAIDREDGRENLFCHRCRHEVPDGLIALSRLSMQTKPADIVFTSTESLNRQLADSGSHAAFGLSGERRLRLVLVDEIHTYEGLSGAQAAYLMRRLRHAAGNHLTWCALSATLADGRGLASQFFGLGAGQVDVVEPSHDELDHVGGEYVMALRHDPTHPTSPLSVTLQLAMLMSRVLDAPEGIGPRPPDSGGLFGQKAFVFADKLDVTNRLYWSLMDAEGWQDHNRPATGWRFPFRTLAHTRSSSQGRMKEGLRESTDQRDADGQWWFISEILGHSLETDRAKNIQLISSQSSGKVETADVVVATASLEVGISDDRVGAVLQHKAPRSAAQYLQRKGRAGRKIEMRPWTVVSLSGWGRDRLAWQTYEQALDPVISECHLPLSNRYVLRIHAMFATLDWLSRRLAGVGSGIARSSWTDLAGPAEMLQLKKDGSTDAKKANQRRLRQEQGAQLLSSVMDRGVEFADWMNFVSSALAISESELEHLFTAAPRPLMLAALPAMQRRLATNWEGERPVQSDGAVKYRHPVPDFVTASLFADLLATDVMVIRPGGRYRDDGTEVAEGLPVARVLREFLPGNVTRHFGGSSNTRHWVPKSLDERHGLVEIKNPYGAVEIGSVQSEDMTRIPLFTPTEVRVEVPETDVRDSTSTSPVWQVEFEPVGRGSALDLPLRLAHALIDEARFYTHATGSAVRVRRFACRGEGQTLRRASDAESHSVTFAVDGQPVALGFEYECDGVAFTLKPAPAGYATAEERGDAARDTILNHPDLAGVTTWYDRERLATVLVGLVAQAVAVEGLTPSELRAMSPAELAERGRRTLSLIADSRLTDEDGNGTDPLAILAFPQAQTVLQCALGVLLGDEYDDFKAWRQRRLAATFGAALVEAVICLAPDIDTEDLAVDLSSDGFTLWITELAPGGNGHVELLVDAIVNSGVGFTDILRSQTLPGEVESLGESVYRAVEQVCSNSKVRATAASLLGAWPGGHRVVETAFDELVTSLRAVGVVITPALGKALSGRLLGPGESVDVVDLAHRLGRWVRDSVDKLGYYPDHRVMVWVAAQAMSSELISYRSGLNDLAARQRLVEMLLWPQGRTAAIYDLGASHQFGSQPDADRLLLLRALGPDVAVVEAGDTTAVATQLLEHGEVLVRYAKVGRDDGLAVRTAILNTQSVPVDVEGLFVYPKVTGVEATDESFIVRLVLEEGPQWIE